VRCVEKVEKLEEGIDKRGERYCRMGKGERCTEGKQVEERQGEGGIQEG
jgi:hypothetical protein